MTFYNRSMQTYHTMLDYMTPLGQLVPSNNPRSRISEKDW